MPELLRFTCPSFAEPSSRIKLSGSYVFLIYKFHLRFPTTTY
ncbi:hypothetical protein VPHF99_0285 [Vibrio phage F99]